MYIAVIPAIAMLMVMKVSRVSRCFLIAGLFGIMGFLLVQQHRSIGRLRAELRSARAQAEEGQARADQPLVDAPPQDPDVQRLKAQAAEVHKLRSEISLLRAEGKSAAAANPPENGNHDEANSTNPQERMRLGQALRREGKHAEALAHLLWAYDEGVKHSPGFAGVRSSFLLNELRDLAKDYPPAREAMLARRDQTEAAILGGSTDVSTIMGLTRLNESVGQPEKSLALFDRLEPNNPARAALADWAGEQFINAGRYQDFVDAGNPEAALDREQFTMNEASKRITGNDFLAVTLRRRFVDSGSRALEALAGVHQPDRAKAIADRVFQVDASPETRARLLKSAERAGDPEVLTYLRKE